MSQERLKKDFNIRNGWQTIQIPRCSPQVPLKRTVCLSILYTFLSLIETAYDCQDFKY